MVTVVNSRCHTKSRQEVDGIRRGGTFRSTGAGADGGIEKTFLSREKVGPIVLHTISVRK